jgi:hypothetical protein
VLTRLGISPRRWLALLPLVGLLLGGCGAGDGREDRSESPQDLPPASNPMPREAQEFVDQGNTAQREGRYPEALAFYQEAMTLAPKHPVPQFGGLMAALAVGDSALAESLREKLELTSPDLLAMLGSGGPMGEEPMAQPGDPLPESGELPPGHPTLTVTPPDTARPDSGRGP